MAEGEAIALNTERADESKACLALAAPADEPPSAASAASALARAAAGTTLTKRRTKSRIAMRSGYPEAKTRTASNTPPQRSCLSTPSASHWCAAFRPFGLTHLTKCVAEPATTASNASSCVANWRATPRKAEEAVARPARAGALGAAVKSAATEGDEEPRSKTCKSSESGSLFLSKKPSAE